MFIECAFFRFKGKFGRLHRNMNINLKELPYEIHSSFFLYNFCELKKETVNTQLVEAALNMIKDLNLFLLWHHS